MSNRTQRIPVTGGASRFPVYDRHGVRLHVGDTVRVQCCVGPYGQTRTLDTTITDPHWPYCFAAVQGAPDCLIDTTYDHGALRCATRHGDVEHAHETWAEVITGENQ